MAKLFKISSWNINSVRARMKILLDFLRLEDPDILCLQETKSSNQDFPKEALAQAGYPHQWLNGQKMHHGVAILAKQAFTAGEVFDWQNNGEARHISIQLDKGWQLHNVYIPAGGDVPDPCTNLKFAQKLDFLKRMTKWSSKLQTPSILLGDFNIAPFPSDVWNHEALLEVVSHTPIEVEALKKLQDSHNWCDTGRHITPQPQRLYSWWSYRAQDWQVSDKGRRLDHIWVSPELVAHVHDCRVIKAVRGWEKPSDHAPLSLCLHYEEQSQ